MSWHSHVVVGYDGSKQGEDVVGRAVAEAKVRRVGLTICHAWHFDYPASQIDPEWLGIVKRMAEHALEHAVFHAHTLAPAMKIKKRLMSGSATSVLLREAGGADLIVLGSRAQTEPLAGSTTTQVTALADCPVLVLRGMPADQREPGRVVVGVDGSAGGDAALRFAFEEAALRGWHVHAVHGCQEQQVGPDSDRERLKRAAGALLERVVAPWREKYPQVPAWTHLMLEPPREALLKVAARAEMLVVGDRGTGGFEPLMLGAVSQAMLHYAPCPVVVAHPWRPPEHPLSRERQERRAQRGGQGRAVSAAKPPIT